MIISGILFGSITFVLKRFVLLFDPKSKLSFKFENLLSYFFELLFFSLIYMLSEFLGYLTGFVDFKLIFLALIIVPLLLSFDFYVKPYYYSFFDKDSVRLTELEEFIFKATKYRVKVYKFKNNDLNIYATGIGSGSKSILIGDKMLEMLDDENLKNLIYHEIGHLKKDHLLYLYLINVVIIIGYFFSCIWLHPLFLQFSLIFEGLLVFLHGMILGLFLVVFPGIIQKKLELSADKEATKFTSKDSYVATLYELNDLTNKQMEKKSINYPTLLERIKNVQEA